MENIKSHRIGVAIDIDGTLTSNKQVIPGARQALEKLIQLNIPYLLLTNNTARSEQTKAAEINKLFNLSKPITEKQVILNYTPIKEKFEGFGDGIVLVIGREARLTEIMPLPFLKNYITAEEYVSLFPETVPLSRRTSANAEI